MADIKELDEEFKYITLINDSNIDIFLKIWLSLSNSEEQRFLGHMNNACLSILSNNENIFNSVNNLTAEHITKTRDKIIKQLYFNEIIQAENILIQFANKIITIVEIYFHANNMKEETVKKLDSLCDILNYAANYNKIINRNDELWEYDNYFDQQVNNYGSLCWYPYPKKLQQTMLLFFWIKIKVILNIHSDIIKWFHK